MSGFALRLTDVDLAFEFANCDGGLSTAAYICRTSGAIYYVSPDGDDIEDTPDDVGDPKLYAELPDKNELDLGTRLVMEFAAVHLPDKVEEVSQIFRSRGAYTKFKHLLETVGSTQSWYDFEAAQTLSRLRSWCAEEGLELLA